MHRKLTITVDETVYTGLQRVVGRQRISQFIEDLVRPHVVGTELSEAYRQMAADEVRESEALDWVEATTADVADEPR
jgi:hypothetical protein